MEQVTSEDDDLVPISALQHFSFCERQCALIHIERIWDENELTVEGRIVHERVDLPGLSDGGKILRAVQLRSWRLGLVGQADVVEFLAPIAPAESSTPFPIEYKRGRKVEHRPDRIQLCAEGMALEEMTGAAVPRGALFYHASRRRVVVEFDERLRRETQQTAERVHEMFRTGTIPRANLKPKCRRCSLQEACQPVSSRGVDPIGYLRELTDSETGTEPP